VTAPRILALDLSVTATGYCQCGCGQRTKIAKRTNLKRGYRRGEPLPFCHQHRLRVEPRSVSARFWSKVEIAGPDDCWPWTGSTQHSGHGKFQASREGEPKLLVMAHRWAYEFAHGPIPNGMVVRHRCDNPHCVNPAHLEVGTQLDNIADMHARGRAYIPDPPRLLGESNPQSKLTDEEVSRLRSEASAGARQVNLARRFGISKAQVCRIVSGKRRRDTL
jgi:hypothetical protein